MKRIALSIYILMGCIFSIAQVPESFSYQAIVRDGGEIIQNQLVSYRFSIIKGVSLTDVIYTEKQNVTTNQLGLVNLAIGNGTDKIGDFSTIDWGTDVFFLKVEIDPAGGTSYVDMGTIQLLSVPYALHAKTSESSSDAVKLTGDQTIAGNKTFSNKIIVSQQGIGTATPDASAALEISSTTQGFLPPRMTLAQRDAITPIAGLQVFNTTHNKPNYYDGTSWRNFDGSPVSSIGDWYQGGIIAYILQSGDPGYDANVQHGLIAAPSDQSASIRWSNGTNTITGATATALGTGNANTKAIVSNQGDGSYAAKLCYDLVLNGFSDWYLPSKDELIILYQNKDAIGGFTSLFYWSSTESSLEDAWLWKFTIGPQIYHTKNYYAYVRAIRAF